MIALPFFVFGIWALSLYRKKGFSVGLYAILLYFITALGSILIDINDFYTYSCPKLELGIIAPIVYCILMCFCLAPLTKLKRIEFRKVKRLKGLTSLLILYLFVFIVVLMVSFTRINEILFQESLADVRNELYIDEAVSFYNHLDGWPRYVCAICATIAPSSLIMCFFFVYSIAYLDHKPWYNIAILVSSLTPILISINVADRSQIVYWVLVFFLSISFFYKDLSPKAIRTIGVIGLFFGILLAIYFFMVTISRFEERDGGTNGGIIAYLGQNYINFCNYLNHVTPGFNLSVAMPVTDKYIFHTTHIPQTTTVTGFELNGFRTFLGHFYGGLGFFFMFIYSLFYYLVTTFVVRKVNSQRYIRYDTLSSLWVLTIVVVLGLFGHFYSTENNVYAIVIWLLIGRYIQKWNFSYNKHT